MKSPRFSPAMAVALTALVVSLGGSSYAAVKVGSSQIKNNSLLGKDIKDATITERDLKPATLTGGVVKDDSLTGADVLESSLAQVPLAKNANTVNDVTVKSFRYRQGGSSAIQTVLELGGLVVKADCSSGVVGLYATTTLPAANLVARSHQVAVGSPPDIDVTNSNFSPAFTSSLTVGVGSNQNESGTADFHAADSYVHLDWSTGVTLGGATCVASGVAFAG